MIGGLFLGFFIDGIFVSVFAARGTDLLQSVRQVTAVPQLLPAAGQSCFLCLGGADICLADDPVHRRGVVCRPAHRAGGDNCNQTTSADNRRRVPCRPALCLQVSDICSIATRSLAAP